MGNVIRTAVRDDARTAPILPPSICPRGVHLPYLAPGDDYARCDCKRPDETGRVPDVSSGDARTWESSRSRPCVTCAAVGVFRWQDTCAAIGHHARAGRAL